MLEQYAVLEQKGLLNAARDVLHQGLLVQSAFNRDFEIKELNQLGEEYNNVGQSETTLHYFVMAYEKFTKADEPDEISFLQIINNIAMAVGAMGYFQESLTLFLFCLEKCEKMKMPLLKIMVLHGAGFAYENILDYENAVKMYQIALDLCASLKEELRLNMIRAKLLNSLGLVNVYQGSLKSAQERLEQSLDIKAKEFGKSHPEYAVTLNNLGLLAHKEENYAKAIEFYKSALAVRQENLSTAHPAYNRTLYHMAESFFALKSLNCALQLAKMVLAFRDNFYPIGHPQILLVLDLLDKINQALKLDKNEYSFRVKKDQLPEYAHIIQKFGLSFLKGIGA